MPNRAAAPISIQERMPMILAVTYCSAEKNEGPGEFPALERYRSQRIEAVYHASKLAGANFRILSGRFGLLEVSEPIPYYDHLLGAQEVAAHAELLTEQLRPLAPQRVVLYSRSLASDPNAAPYRESLRQACQTLDVPFEIHELPDGRVPPRELAEKL